MPKPTIWSIQDHTKAKHELLKCYLEAWFPILTIKGFNRRVIFMDGFAGPGIYEGGEYGSPIIAIDTLVNHQVFDRLSDTQFLFIFVESHRDRYKSLKQQVSNYWSNRIGGKPDNIVIKICEDEFKRVANQLIEATDKTGSQLAPTFAFIDPFGFSGVPLNIISELLASDKCEVLFNFMYDSVNRWVTSDDPKIAQHFSELFGTTGSKYSEVSNLGDKDRKEFLCQLYLSQLQQIGGFKYVRSFEFISKERGRTEYFLMFGTRHIKGLEAMKDAMWKLDPSSGVQFRGSAGNQTFLFGPEVDTVPLEKALLDEFAERSIPVDEIEQFVIMETDYKRSHYKRVLKKLEGEGKITCPEPPFREKKRRHGTFPQGTVVDFRSDRLFSPD